MAFTNWKIYRIPYDDGWDIADQVEITQFYDPLLQVALGEGRDSFAFKLVNFNDTYDNAVGANDQITIYRTTDTLVATDTDILMVGSVTNTPIEETGTANTVRVEGVNRSETLMDAIIFKDFQGTPINEALQEALENANSKNKNFQVTWDPTNATARSNGTAFPTVTERFFNVPIKKVLEQYSTASATGDGNYYWYVTNDNKLRWFQQDDPSSNTYTFDNTTDEHRSLKIGKDTSDVRNYVILKGGYDPAGKQIQTRYVDESSVAKHGQKFKLLISKNTTGQQLVDSDRKRDYGDLAANQTTTYPDITSSAYTTTWAWPGASGVTIKGTTIEVTKDALITINEGSESANKSAYTKVLREVVKLRLESEGENFVKLFKGGKLKVDLEFRAGTKSWVLGDKITCSISNLSGEPKVLRVTEIQYSTTSDIYSLEEDVGSL